MDLNLPIRRNAVKSFIKDRLSPVADLLGIYDFLLARMVFARSGWLILMYHRVVESCGLDPYRLGMCVSREHFRAQIEFLSQHFTVLTVEAALARLARGQPLPEKLLSITFDDGYADFLESALPVLREFSCPATLYPTVTLNAGQAAKAFWWDRVIDAVARTQRASLSPREAGFSGGPREWSLDPARRGDTLCQMLDACWREAPEKVEARVSQLRLVLGVRGHSALLAPRLSDEQLAALDPAWVELGVHGISHTDLSRQAPDRVLQEIQRARSRLEDIRGTSIAGVAYPGGRQNSSVQTIVQAAGFDYAVGTSKGMNRGRLERYNLLRVGMPDTPVADLKRSLSLAVRERRAATGGHAS